MSISDPKSSFVYGPVTGMTVYKRSIKVHRKMPEMKTLPPLRGEIKSLSRSSLNRLAFTAVNQSLPLRSILTLTYSARWTKSGLEVKLSLNTFLTGLRRRYSQLSYLWFLEFQRRGAPHLHVLTNVIPIADDRQWVAEMWVRATGTGGSDAKKMVRVHSHSKCWELIRSEDGAARYALKYATKPHQKRVPKDFRDVGRFWGCSRDITASANEVVATMDCNETSVRDYCVVRGRDMSGWQDLPGQIWVSGFDNSNGEV